MWPPEMSMMQDPAMATMAQMAAMSQTFPSMPAGADPEGMVTHQGLSQCAPLKQKNDNLFSRIQKLERSRGQINKDIADMLKEAQDWNRKSGSEVKMLPRPERPLSDPTSNRPPAAAPKPSVPARIEGAYPSMERPTPEPNKRPLKEMPALARPTSGPARLVTPPPGLGAQEAPQLTVSEEKEDGKTVHKVKWRIDRVESKFRDCIGRPHVSQPFEVKGEVDLPELRLMVIPNLGQDITGLTMKEQKSRYEAVIKEGPLTGALKLKVVNNVGNRLMITFNLVVGSVKKGPFVENFADRIIHGYDFENNWLEEIESESLTVGVEILAVNGDYPGGPPGLRPMSSPA